MPTGNPPPLLWGAPPPFRATAGADFTTTILSSESCYLQVYWANEHTSFPPGGKLSQWLAEQPIGTMVEAKGPTGHFHYQGRGK